ncbi:glycogen/starch synthase [Tenacibaculum piscium]|uniref:starch synthase n=1 Tax=Tenacibaculum piscium TaxID=1458515 RepID=A0A2H1YJP6_9FLAO|nr:glycogen/starch synthase [Tenacibaculum piscium]MBE7629468.1 glycogen synthase [Tenacibaculum piscium]MBE7671339.1 glycogen synthase [Tenacibaculum piscium]MBE7686167.1 glycogen synthase [Tenacibaculum piscium]MBE7689904.1 glycogen synthase [Tenacibaculum piscium]MCG8183074.1 glycogen/starch synthase [Tenacibaculum piscium]
MKDKRILYVSSEVIPYLPETELSSTAFNVAKNAHSKGVQTRIFMPRYGVINERRHQLHEVIRLSGMNLIINDMDMPLIIKVASIPKERMQVYFIDNEEYFKRKAVYSDEDDNLFSDNDERMIFFAKGVIETVKKLNWAPDVIHIHGWLASLLPLYLREFYKEEPLFTESKIVTSIYENNFDGELNPELANKVRFDKIDESKITTITTPNQINILKSAIENSDAIVKGSEVLPDEINDFIAEKCTKVLEFQSEETLAEAYLDFYKENVLEISE